MTRHGANMGKLMVKTEKEYLGTPTYVQGMVVFNLCYTCHFVTWVIDELILIIYYYTILLLV